GILTTAGNLVLAGHTSGVPGPNGSTKDPKGGGSVSAYNAMTGASLWNSEQLDGGAGAPSMTYSVNGKQYISIFAGGGGSGKKGDSIYTWALP
ncbi:MAG: hypothetical protein M3Q30_27570, partial [Actinomycetota bacterium]|nr:hypothetical protein [Actinomycetota bacterium]